jgi:uncharacterized protein (DUF2147 family)
MIGERAAKRDFETPEAIHKGCLLLEVAARTESRSSLTLATALFGSRGGNPLMCLDICYGERRMRLLIILMLAGVALYTAAVPALALQDDAVFGKWRDVESGGLLEVYPCGGNVCIKIAQVTEPGATDVNNPDRALRDRPLLGVVIMADGKKSTAAVWDGHLYNTKDGKTYSGSIKLVSESELKVSGCALGGLICSGRAWQKVNQ